MLRVDQAHVLRHKVLVEGRVIRAVAREMRVSRNTVRKYLKESEPKRKVAWPSSRAIEEKVKPAIEAILDRWKDRTTTREERAAGFARLRGVASHGTDCRGERRTGQVPRRKRVEGRTQAGATAASSTAGSRPRIFLRVAVVLGRR